MLNLKINFITGNRFDIARERLIATQGEQQYINQILIIHACIHVHEPNVFACFE